VFKKIARRLFVPKIKGISINEVRFLNEELIFPQEIFELPEQLDIFGQKHDLFAAYTCVIPPFFVRSIKKAKCIVGKEEIFTSNNRVVVEQTSQKVNPWLGSYNRILKKPQKVNGSVVNFSLSGIESNYYHWLTECLGSYYLLEQSSFKPDFYLLSVEKSFQKQYIELLKIDKKRIIEIEPGNAVQADEIIVPSSISISGNWEHIDSRGYIRYQKQWLPSWIGNMYKERIDLVRYAQGKNKIYISRSFADYRKIENENEIIDLLKARGYGIYHLENMSVEEQVELFSNASIVLGVHGAGFTNIYFCPRSALIFEFFTEHYHDSSFKVLTTSLGLKYHYMIGKTSNIENVHPQQENVYIDLAQLKTALDILDSTAHNN
jgi:capsular polysaccharide biosynthesis protein